MEDSRINNVGKIRCTPLFIAAYDAWNMRDKVEAYSSSKLQLDSSGSPIFGFFG